MTNILLKGSLGSGKSTIATELENSWGYKKFSIARPVKEMTEILLKRKIDKKTDRTLLQQVGQYFKTSLDQIHLFNPNFVKYIDDSLNDNEQFKEYYEKYKKYLFDTDCWLNILSESDPNFIHYLKKGKVVIDDVRFLNEPKYINKINQDTIIVQVEANLNTIRERCIARDGLFNPEWLEDISEKEKDLIKPNVILISDTNRTIKEMVDDLIDYCIILR